MISSMLECRKNVIIQKTVFCANLKYFVIILYYIYIQHQHVRSVELSYTHKK